LALLIPGFTGAARASTTPFSLFLDSLPNQWNYSFGHITATAAVANFFSFPPPNQILNYSGPVTYTVDANSTGLPVINGNTITQPFGGHMTFKSGSATVLDVVFVGALLSGQQGSLSGGIAGDTNISGEIISYSADPGFVVSAFDPPYSFSISLTGTSPIGLNGNQTALNPFTATASGSFAAEAPPAGAGVPEPASVALLGIAAPLLLRRGKRASR
jgi:hypothetical protein